MELQTPRLMMELQPPIRGNLYENLDDGKWFIYNGENWVEVVNPCPNCGYGS